MDSSAGSDGRRGQGEGTGRIRRIKDAYETVALIVFNVVVMVVLLNLLLGAGYLIRDVAAARASDSEVLFHDDGTPIQTGKRTDYHLNWFDLNAYGESPEYVGELLDAFYYLEQEGYVYQPWVQFVRSPFSSRLLNIDFDERGFPIRRTINEHGSDADPVVRVFTLGGSTTFGHHVSDEHTWPSFLSEALNERARAEGFPYRIEVVNYGRGYYFPGQQAILLQDLLKNGHRPSLVIFMDGVNWGGVREQPQMNGEAAAAFIERQHGRSVRLIHILAEYDWVPMFRFAVSLREGMRPPAADHDGVRSPELWDEWIHYAANRFEQSAPIARSTCELYGCEITFFLQPNAVYRYNLDLYRRELPESFINSRKPTVDFYARMGGSEFYVDLSHLFEEFGAERQAIVDDIHYAPEFSRFLAERVAAAIDLQSLPVFDPVVDESAATGRIRSLITRHGRVEP